MKDIIYYLTEGVENILNFDYVYSEFSWRLLKLSI